MTNDEGMTEWRIDAVALEGSSFLRHSFIRASSFYSVIDLNHILLFIACISPLVMLGQTLRRGGLYRPWRLASFAVLIVTGTAWFVNPERAGFIGGGAVLTPLLLPTIGLRKISELASHQSYAAARRLSRPFRFL